MSLSKCNMSVKDFEDQINLIRSSLAVTPLNRELSAEASKTLANYLKSLDQTIQNKNFGKCSFLRCDACARDSSKCADCGHTYGGLFNQTIKLMKIVYQHVLDGKAFNLIFWSFLVNMSFFAEDLSTIVNCQKCSYDPKFECSINDQAHMSQIVFVERQLENPKLLDYYIYAISPNFAINPSVVLSRLFHHEKASDGLKKKYMTTCDPIDEKIPIALIVHLINAIDQDLKKESEKGEDMTDFVHLIRISFFLKTILNSYLCQIGLI